MPDHGANGGDGDELIGRLLDDRYQIELCVGEGAMGTVYRARQTRLRRTVAIKIPKANVLAQPQFVARFEREALSMAKVVHENIVQIFDVHIAGADSADPSFIAMEYVEGAELHRFLRAEEANLTLRALLDLLAQIGRGLDAAHAHGIVHRDIKPSNIVVTMPQRVPKIMDFGIARVEMDGVFETVDVLTIGTPAYMPPEQASGGAITPASDIYAFAGTMYHLLTGALPFNARGGAALLAAHAWETPIPPSSRNPNLPRDLDDALLRGLAKEPENRHASASGLVREVARALEPLADRPLAVIFSHSATVAEPSTGAGPRPATATATAPGTRTATGTATGASSATATELPGAPRKRTVLLALALGVPALFLLALVGAVGLGSFFNQSRRPADSEPPPPAAADPTPPPAEVTPPPTPAPATATPSPAAPTATPVPPATATPTPPTPTATARPTKTAAPTASPEPVAPTTEAPAGSRWDPAAHPPLRLRWREARVQREVEAALDALVKRPAYQGLTADLETNLGGQDVPGVGALLAALQSARTGHDEVSLRLILSKDSLYWEDRAKVFVDYTIHGSPHGVPDKSYRRQVERSAMPLVLRLEKANDQWRIVTEPN